MGWGGAGNVQFDLYSLKMLKVLLRWKCWKCCYVEDVATLKMLFSMKMLKLFLRWRCCYVEDVATLNTLKTWKLLLRWKCCYVADVATFRRLSKVGRFNKTSHKKIGGNYGRSCFAEETWPGGCDDCLCTISQGSDERGAKYGALQLFRTWNKTGCRNHEEKREKYVRWQDDLQSLRFDFWRSADGKLTILCVHIYK